MKQKTKDVILVVFWLLVLLGFMIYFSRSEKVQAKIDQILGAQDCIYVQCRKNLQGSNSHGL